MHTNQENSFTNYKNPSSKQQQIQHFFMCVLESLNIKYETLKPHYGDKPPKQKKIGTPFTVHMVLTTHGKL
jgi:hypothetical protein